ncbi:fatty acid desaturase [Nocardia suismassiliense]|uniref:fatty acid desaturase n=1 Tax=Nocardia suismassiliense TaxID=2077092 RepID=UPI000D1E4F24|nr:fatty acid desaturase [Nocardia suismassiliense]
MRLATRLPGERSLAEDDADRISSIREQIMLVGDRWRTRHPWIGSHQDAIGMTIFVAAILGVLGDAALYAVGVLPWWVTIVVTAFWLSLLHELEHDLIHSMYFRTNKWVHNAMILGVWVFRPSTINPWVRRRLHLHHHEVSGTDSDLEERGITNGQRWGGHRLLSLLDTMLGIYTRPFRTHRIVNEYVARAARDAADARFLAVTVPLGYFPLGAIHYGLWHIAIGVHVYELFGGSVPHNAAYDAMNFLAITLLAPNAIRTFCLHFVSSNLHYYGDVEAHNVLQQTQVWTAKWLWPMQALCFNFGGTHAIHHFLVRDPFYVREAIRRDCQVILRERGVRFNDFGTFRRGNRFSLGSLAGPVEP